MLSVEIDMSSVSQALRDFGERSAPLFSAKMLTNTAFKAREALITEMQNVFDRPTPYTLRSPWVTRAVENDPNPYAEVFIGHPAGGGVPAWKYLQPQVEGGPRRSKSSERQLREAGILPPNLYLIPTGRVDMDAYGNVPGSIMTKILSSINAFGEVGYSANQYGRRGRGVRRNDSYFAIRPGHPGLPPGIYKRTPQGGHVMVFTFGRTPVYNPRFDFHGTVKTAVEAYVGQVAAAAFREAMQSGRLR